MRGMRAHHRLHRSNDADFLPPAPPSWAALPLPWWMKALRQLRPLFSALAAPFVLYRRKRNAPTRVAGLRLNTRLDVFHPRYFWSTRLLLRRLDSLPLAGKTVLDMGTGTGVIGIYAARKGARVTAVDINPSAVELAGENAALHGVTGRMSCNVSDLFAAIATGTRFDLIVFNPPFYAGAPASAAEAAFFAGDGFSSVERFLEEARAYLAPKGSVIMILTSDMPLVAIDAMRQRYGYRIASHQFFRHLFEIFHILQLTCSAPPDRQAAPISNHAKRIP